jgi:lipoate-protein ligase A
MSASTAAGEQAWNRRQLAAVPAAALVRVWTHRSPAVVLGCAQRSLRDAIERRTDGEVPLVDRSAGGGAVLAGPWMISVSIVLPGGHRLLGATLIDCYRWLGQLHVEALAACGVRAYALPSHEVQRAEAVVGARTVSWACFGALSPWEVVAPDCRKLVGLAQRRQRSGVLLVAGTLVADPEWSLLCDLMGYPEDESALRRRTVSCRELAGRTFDPRRYAATLQRSLEAAVSDQTAASARSSASSAPGSDTPSASARARRASSRSPGSSTGCAGSAAGVSLMSARKRAIAAP